MDSRSMNLEAVFIGAFKETDKQIKKRPGHLWDLSETQPPGAQVE